MSTSKRNYIPQFRIFLAVVFILFAFFVSQIVAGGIVYIVATLGGASQTEATKLIEDSTLYQFAFLAIAMAIEIGLFYGITRITKLNLEYLYPKNFKLEKIWIIAIGLAVYMVMSTIVAGMLKGVIDENQKQIIGFENVHGVAELIMVFGALVVLAPLAEEILFRGFLYSEFRKKASMVLSIIFVSVLFGSFHLQLGSGKPPLWAGFADTFFLSVVLCYIREKTNTIWYGVGIHSLKNFLAFLLLFVFNLRI